jgi:hypothetical protein
MVRTEVAEKYTPQILSQIHLRTKSRIGFLR